MSVGWHAAFDSVRRALRAGGGPGAARARAAREERRAARAWLRATLPGIFFVRELAATSVDELVDAFEFYDVGRGERVIAQGDEGNYLYLVFAGRLEAHVRMADADETRLVKSYNGNGFFGELALM